MERIPCARAVFIHLHSSQHATNFPHNQLVPKENCLTDQSPHVVAASREVLSECFAVL